MKVFIAESKEQGYITATNYHWCDDNDLLMFGQFQIYNRDGDVSMCGIRNRLFTTNIIVKDMNIDRDFYRELLIESVEKAMNTDISNNGEYNIKLNGDWNMDFNIDNIIDELLEKANCFEDGQKVRCIGRNLYIRKNYI